MDAAAMKQKVRYVLETVIPEGRFEEIANCVTEDYVDFDPPAGAPSGPGALHATIESLHKQFGTPRFEVTAAISEGDLVAVCWTLRGEDAIGFLDGVPSHRPLSSTGMAWFRFRGDRICERWASYDRTQVIAQLRGSVQS